MIMRKELGFLVVEVLNVDGVYTGIRLENRSQTEIMYSFRARKKGRDWKALALKLYQPDAHTPYGKLGANKTVALAFSGESFESLRLTARFGRDNLFMSFSEDRTEIHTTTNANEVRVPVSKIAPVPSEPTPWQVMPTMDSFRRDPSKDAISIKASPVEDPKPKRAPRAKKAAGLGDTPVPRPRKRTVKPVAKIA